MLTALTLLFLSQTSPAIRRTTPASDDPGMVVRQVGTVTVTCTNCSSGGSSDSGTTVIGGWTPDGGNIGFMRMPDGGPLEVNVMNTVEGSGGWVPDGGFIGSVYAITDGGVTAYQGGTWSVTANAGTGTFAVSAASLPLPSGASTSALQSTGNTSIASIDTKTPVLGQATMANSSPVVIASNQSALATTAAQGVGTDGGLGWNVVQSNGANLRTQTASEGTVGSAVPTTASAAGFSDGTNTRVPRVFDFDTSGGTQWGVGTAIYTPSFGGGVAVTGQSDQSGYYGLTVYPQTKLVLTPTTTSVTCGTTATAAPASVLGFRMGVTFHNYSDAGTVIFIGGSGVTTANGMPLAPGEKWKDEVRAAPYYCIVGSGTADLRVLEN